MLWRRIHPTYHNYSAIGFTTNWLTISVKFQRRIRATSTPRVTEVGAGLHAGVAHDGGKTRGGCARFSRGLRDNRIAHMYKGRGGGGYCFRRGEPRARACGASQQTEAGSGRGSIRSPARSWTSKKPAARRSAAAARLGSARHGTAPDTKHSQTAWRPPVSFVSAPASRRPRRYYPSTDPAIRRSPVRARVPSVELVNDARSLIPSIISQLPTSLHLIAVLIVI